MRLAQLLHKVERRSRSLASELPNCVTIFEYQVYWNIAAKCKGIADLAALKEDESDASPAQQNDRTFPLAFFAGVRGLRGFLLCGAVRCGEVSWSGYLVHFRFFQL